MLVSLFLVGTILGAFSGGSLADAFGRKKTLFLMSILFFGSALYLGDAHGAFTIYMGRFVAGIAVGIASAVVPVYIAEISPTAQRGLFVCIAQVMIVIGVLCSFLVSWALCGEQDWRGMFFWAAVPAAILFAALFFLPDSMGSKNVEGSLSDAPKEPIFIGSFLNVLQQITGINIIICFTPRIFQLSGLGEASHSIGVTVLIGVVNVAATLLGLWVIDRLGRRPLALFGFGGMALSLFGLWAVFLLKEPSGPFAIASLIVFIACFAIGPGLVTSLVCSEIFPPPVRGRAMGIAMFSNWTSNLALTTAFLPLAGLFGMGTMFFFLALFSVLSIAFVWKKVPETKGKTFEEIQRLWQK